MSKVKKIAKVSLIVLLSLALVIGVGLSILYFNVTAIRFEYKDTSKWGINYPFFCNPILSDSPPTYTLLPMDLGRETIKVYVAVNDPMEMWTRSVSRAHEGENIDIGYNVENDGKTLKVSFSGTAGDTPIDKEFVFDIQNASPKNLPKWTNRTEADDEIFLI